jgi:uridine kinase
METRTKLISVVGGSGSGKTWLINRLRRVLGPCAAGLSLDDFYHDRSALAPPARQDVNYDHPQAVDWALFEAVARQCRAGHAVRTPRYSFTSHTRSAEVGLLLPAGVVLVDGLWLLLRRNVRALFDFNIFLECPAQLRLERRLARDLNERGRSAASVREQFWKTVAPMHDRYVAPQRQWADIVLEQPASEQALRDLGETIRAFAVEDDPQSAEEIAGDRIARCRRGASRPPVPNAARDFRKPILATGH